MLATLTFVRHACNCSGGRDSDGSEQQLDPRLLLHSTQQHRLRIELYSVLRDHNRAHSQLGTCVKTYKLVKATQETGRKGQMRDVCNDFSVHAFLLPACSVDYGTAVGLYVLHVKQGKWRIGLH
jgi:hypothetical protein